MASSRIEDIAVSHERLARAAYRGSGDAAPDRRAAEVLGNVAAMKRAIELGSPDGPLSVDDILDIHRTLLRVAAVRQLVSALPAHPIVDVAAAREITGKSHVAVGAALRQLEAADIVRPLHERRWGRAWECGELLDLVASFERDLASR